MSKNTTKPKAAEEADNKNPAITITLHAQDKENLCLQLEALLRDVRGELGLKPPCECDGCASCGPEGCSEEGDDYEDNGINGEELRRGCINNTIAFLREADNVDMMQAVLDGRLVYVDPVLAAAFAVASDVLEDDADEDELLMVCPCDEVADINPHDVRNIPMPRAVASQMLATLAGDGMSDLLDEDDGIIVLTEDEFEDEDD